VHVVRAEALQALVEGAQGGVVAVVAVPQLGGEEYLLARDAGVADRTADAAFVLVRGGGVDVAVADLEGGGDHVEGLCVGDLPDPVPQLRDAGAVIQSDVLHCFIPSRLRPPEKSGWTRTRVRGSRGPRRPVRRPRR